MNQFAGSIVDGEHKRGLGAAGRLGLVVSEYEKSSPICRIVFDVLAGRAPAQPQLEPTTAHLVEHADLFQQANWVVEGQDVAQRTQADVPCALRHS